MITPAQRMQKKFCRTQRETQGQEGGIRQRHGVLQTKTWSALSEASDKDMECRTCPSTPSCAHHHMHAELDCQRYCPTTGRRGMERTASRPHRARKIMVVRVGGERGGGGRRGPQGRRAPRASRKCRAQSLPSTPTRLPLQLSASMSPVSTCV